MPNQSEFSSPGCTGLFAAALLLHRQEAASVEDAVTLLKTARPGIRLNPLQTTCLRQYAILLERKRKS